MYLWQFGHSSCGTLLLSSRPGVILSAIDPLEEEEGLEPSVLITETRLVSSEVQ